ncbi:MAG: glycosyltransferase [Winogradskyella sp.]|nr:glycosyltransferase [Winogradskyella sp.]
MKSITVSVFILTYNQETYISQTIASILAQQTNFAFQLVIGEDHSTDKTRTIIKNYVEQYPDKIKLLPALNSNIGLIGNYMQTIRACDGKYIAICDGDDYWIDTKKLQKQVDFLEQHPDFSIVFTSIKKELANGDFKPGNMPAKYILDFNDLVYDNFIPSVSVLFRNHETFKAMPKWMLKYPYGDWPTYLLLLKDGAKIKYLDDVTAVHRIEAGITASLKKDLSSLLKTNLNILKDVFNDQQFAAKRPIVKQAMYALSVKLMTTYNREKHYFKALIQFLRNLSLATKTYYTVNMYLYSLSKSFK